MWQGRQGLFVSIVLPCLLLWVTQAQSAQLTIPSSGLALLQKASYLKPTDANKILHFTVWLKYRNKAQLDQLSREIYDAKSPHYQQFLKPGEFEARFSPTKATKQLVADYFNANGMTGKIDHDRIEVTASVQQIARVLKTEINDYQLKDHIGYSNASEPKLPAEIGEHIAQITGLSTLFKLNPTLHPRPLTLLNNVKFTPHDLNFTWKNFKPYAQPTTTSFVGFTGDTLRLTYQLASIPPVKGQSIDGQGQTIVIIDACGTNSVEQIRKDANLYNDANGLTRFTDANFTVINPDGTPFTHCGSPNAGWDQEIALDIEASHTFIPAANTVLVLTQSDFSPLFAAIDEVTDVLINNHYIIGGFSNAYVISNSWGGSETAGSSPGVEASLEKASLHGLSFNFSTGDCGDQQYNSSWPCSIQSGTPTVQFPGSSAFVTAVGATSLFVDNFWNYAFESLWGSYLGGFYGGTTGGISQYYGPVSWQSSISSFTAGGYTSGTVGTYNKRALPDISMLGDPYTGLTIYEGGSSFVYGGTSLACPLFSGTLVLLNQIRMALNNDVPRPIGQAAPYLYLENELLLTNNAIHLVTPPHTVISGAKLPPAGAPISAFKIYDAAYGYELTFGWDSSLTIQPENQFWNDGVGVGSVNVVNFLVTMASV